MPLSAEFVEQQLLKHLDSLPPPAPSMFETMAIYWVELHRSPGKPAAGEEVAPGTPAVTPRVPVMFAPSLDKTGRPVLINAHLIVLPRLNPHAWSRRRGLIALISDQSGQHLFRGPIAPLDEDTALKEANTPNAAETVWIGPYAIILSSRDP